MIRISWIYIWSCHESQFHCVGRHQGVICMILNCDTIHKKLDRSWSSNHCVNMHFSIIIEFRLYPSSCCLRNSCHTWFLSNIKGCSDSCWEHVCFCISISVNEKDIDFLPWCTEVGSKESCELIRIPVKRWHYYIMSSIQSTAVESKLSSGPITEKSSISTKSWIGWARSFWNYQFNSTEVGSRYRYILLNICVRSKIIDCDVLVNTKESLASLPIESSIVQCISCYVEWIIVVVMIDEVRLVHCTV